MRMRNALLASTAATAALVFQLGLAAPALAQSAAALAGKVSSAAEPVMEGVVVSAKKDGSTITVSVVTDDKGHYSFPAARLEPGHYTLSARAVGYDLDGPKAADVTAGQAATADLKLKPTRTSPSQLTNAEWLMSMPGTDEQKIVPAQLHQLPHPRAHRADRPTTPTSSRRSSSAWAAIIRAARRPSRSGWWATCARDGRPTATERAEDRRNGSPAST